MVRETEEFSPKQGRESFHANRIYGNSLKRIEQVGEYVFLDEQGELGQAKFHHESIQKMCEGSGT